MREAERKTKNYCLRPDRAEFNFSRGVDRTSGDPSASLRTGFSLDHLVLLAPFGRESPLLTSVGLRPRVARLHQGKRTYSPKGQPSPNKNARQHAGHNNETTQRITATNGVVCKPIVLFVLTQKGLKKSRLCALLSVVEGQPGLTLRSLR